MNEMQKRYFNNRYETALDLWVESEKCEKHSKFYYELGITKYVKMFGSSKVNEVLKKYV